MKYGFFVKGTAGVLLAVAGMGCGKEEVITQQVEENAEESARFISLEEVASLLSTLPLEAEQVQEVWDATLSSAGNGYDEEYRMQDLFHTPGSGVGSGGETRASSYKRPLRELLRSAAKARFSTKADGEEDPEAWLDSLAASDVQIYWPGPDSWNGKELPVSTYDPGDGAERNEGYELLPDGSVRKIMVDEQMSLERPVWVVNRNSDAEYKSLELLRREDPSWGNGGGDIVVSKASDGIQTLVLRSFKAHRQYDSWFAGASEFWVKCGSVENFKATSEDELQLYKPSITDFMIVVRRNQVGEELPFNAVLVSEWTSGLESMALMMIEDDGGTRTTWKANATVKYNSKSYGIDVEFPLNTRDDIVWRGSLSHQYIRKYSGQSVRFGDVELVLELL